MKTRKSVLKTFLFSLTILFCSIVNAQPLHLNKTLRKQVVDNISLSLKDNYIYLDTAIRMSKFINSKFKAGAYDTIITPSVFASKLTSDLLSVYSDGHLSIEYNPNFSTGNSNPNTTDEEKPTERMLKFRKRVNFGFEKAEILPGNIGYLKINGFFAPDNTAREMAIASLRFISNSEVLIIDLRNNMGGDPGMVSYICGFFFKDKTHLNDLYSRKDKSNTSYWAIPDSTVKSLNTIPIYLLTSKKTFSAGEEFTYDLQTQKRAIIIGETTGGGAHPVQPFAIGNGFVANVPFARAINPITKTDWETKGVKPDIEVPAEKALDVTLSRIKKK